VVDPSSAIQWSKCKISAVFAKFLEVEVQLIRGQALGDNFLVNNNVDAKSDIPSLESTYYV
jgi:hypothetical protein